MKIEGICPIAPAVYNDKGEFDYEDYRSCCDAMLKGGAHSLALFGIAGEFYKLDREEEENLIDITVEVCHANNSPVVISNTRHSTEVAIKWAKRIEASGADCMMVLPPFFLKPGGAALTKHIEALCDAVDIPIMLQYAPEQTGVAIPPETLAEIGNKHENLNYYKIECKPPGAYISKLRTLLGGKGEIFIGNAGFQMVEGFQRGAVGVMPGPSMFDVYRKIYDLIKADKIEEAEEMHLPLNGILNHIRQNVEMIIHFEKKILQKRGLINSDYCRHPGYICDDLTQKIFEQHYEKISKYFGYEA
ncbi:MAG: dihydrodipicolinate synthase family protein [Kiritimatiellae bacterium]|jgi:2-keto-3-deoxy-L-arabinonate dehydratase|nr:dihydrodipicolinate synthase family protein [Kiritimatiellia bacterium]